MKHILRCIASTQQKYPLLLLAIAIILTVIVGTGLPKIQVQSDFSKENPRQLPAYVLTDRISDEFGGETNIFLIFEVDENDENDMIDLRNPSVIKFMKDLETTLKSDSRVISTSSIGTIMQEPDFKTREDIKAFLETNPAYSSFFSEDYRLTFLTITSSIGESYEEIVPFEQMLNEKISSIDNPGGVTLFLTGGAPFGKVIRETIFKDAFKTIGIASLGIFILLIITIRSIKKSIIVFTPLIFALIWAGGLLGYSGIKLSIACVAVGSIILGLGVEYGVFMITRYNEERFMKKQSQNIANQEAVSNIGAALMGSGTTTFAGFIALMFSITPMMQILGLSLAVGIGCCMLSAIFVTPLIILISENIEIALIPKSLERLNKEQLFFSKN